MTTRPPHVVVCICTYQRRALLERLLRVLADQQTDGRFTYSIVVVDNDAGGSARAVVEAASTIGAIPIEYDIEPRRSIPLARNKAVAHAAGEYVALIDDDECPTARWLLTLVTAIHDAQADGVLGPVLPRFDPNAPRWVRVGGFYDRPRHRSGQQLAWSDCRTGNAILKAELFAEDECPFDPQFLGGEDHDFFKRMIDRGHSFVWCDEAVVFEAVPAARWKRGFLIRRALFRGVFSLRQRRFGVASMAWAVMAAAAYAISLPVTLLMGQTIAMRCAFRFSYHLGQVLAILGVNPIKQPYVTD